jgi:glycosyltransferase involved in cell wall biosynthesis
LANIFLKKESRLLRYEQCAYLGVDEINSLPKRYRKNACIIPFYIDIQSQKYYNENGYLLYMGTFNYQPNKEALKRILKIASSISSPIKIFGTNIPKIYHLPKNTELAGYVTSLDEVFMGAKALICPITSGSGIKNKVIEAMSYGIPVIGFKNAFTNLNIEHNKNVIIAKNLSEMIYIANNADLKHISKNAYLFIKDEMSKDLALNKILKIINKER